MKKYVFLIMIFVVVWSCNQADFPGVDSNPGQETATVTIRIPIPDYHNHIFTATQPTGRIIDPANHEIEITVSAPDMETITDVFDFASLGSFNHENGMSFVDCQVTGIPWGQDRLFEVVTRDSLGAALTVGECYADVNAGSIDEIFIGLCPDNYTVVGPGTILTGETVAYGRMNYYQADITSGGVYQVQLESTADDVDLYLFNNYGSSYEDNDFWETGAPASETGYIFEYYMGIYYLAVFGNSDTGMDNVYDLTFQTYTGTTFDPAIVIEERTPGTWDSISGTGTPLWSEGDGIRDKKEIPIGFDFSFHGDLYQSVYISVNGYISFWSCGSTGVPYVYPGYPVNYIALYGTQNWLYLDKDENIYHQLQGISPDRRLVIEFNVEKILDETQLLVGQIVLHENGEIELLYDHAACTIYDDAVIGLVNDDYTDISLLAEVNGVPENDLWFGIPSP